MANKITLPGHETALFAELIANLTRQGVAFEACLFASNFVIEITGY